MSFAEWSPQGWSLTPIRICCSVVTGIAASNRVTSVIQENRLRHALVRVDGLVGVSSVVSSMLRGMKRLLGVETNDDR